MLLRESRSSTETSRPSPLATALIDRAAEAKIPASWVVGDEVFLLHESREHAHFANAEAFEPDRCSPIA